MTVYFTRFVVHSCRILILYLAWAPPLLALDPHKAISQYGYSVWQTGQGLPQGTVMSIAQTPDGYLWLGTPVGLVRFDGSQFRLIEEEATARFGVWHLYVSRDGSLWISTYGGGLLRFKNGKFTRYTIREGLSDDQVRTVYEDREGNLWIGTFSQGVCALREGRITHYAVRDGLAHNNVKSIVEDANGDIWIATFGGGLSRFRHGKFYTFTERDGLPNNNVREILRDHRGDLWVATPRGLGLRRNGRFYRFTAKDGLRNNDIVTLLEDRDGNLWIGTEGGGLWRYIDGRFTSFTTQDGLASGDIKALFEDRQGNLWIGTNGGGLCQLRERNYTVYTTKEGLSNNHATAVYEGRDNSLWVGTINGLNRFTDGKFTPFKARGGLSSNNVMALLEDRAGSLWIGTHSGGLNRISGGRITVFSRRDGLSHDVVNALYEDSRGYLWVGTAGGGLNVLIPDSRPHRAGRWRIRQITTADGLAGDRVLVMREAHDGSLWVGARGGLSHLEIKTDCAAAPCLARVTNYSTSDGVPGTIISALYEDGDGTLWIGARDGGLARFTAGRFQSLTVKEGLAESVILQIIAEPSGALWLFGDRGYSRLERQELDEFFAGRRRSVKPFFLAREDGSGTSIFDVTGQPAATITRRGQLWFPTLKGVTMIDPAELVSQPAPPPVYLEEFVVDRKTMALSEGLRLSPGNRTYEFHYLGVSLIDAEKLRFRYRLEGFDPSWVDAGARRVAYYTNLPPGRYRFRVAARVGDGDWSEAAASPWFTQLPHVYQTYWFWAALVGLVGLLAWYFHRLRMRRIAAEHAAVLAERARLAREIHDSLIQGVVGISTYLEIAVAELPDSPPKVRDSLNQLRILIRNSLDDARRMIFDLRQPALERHSLATALRDLAQRLAIDTPIQVEMKVDGQPRALPAHVEEQLLRVGQEAVKNVIRHAQARRIQIELHYDAGVVRLLVHDDGRGFDPQSPDAQYPGHFGLVGMRERVEGLGGKLFITSSAEEGTIVEAEIPEKRAAARKSA
ncbi:MAG TPA: two-component regulator propeller domain-containing protein [Blastocatellia bacterium]